MRFASEGPIRGRCSIASAGAVSRSRGVEDVDGVEGVEGSLALEDPALDSLDAVDTLDDLCRLAESTSASWRSRASEAARGGGPRLLARCARTPAPRSATAAKKSRAWRSDGVTVWPRQ
jgi:hypothetical protein